MGQNIAFCLCTSNTDRSTRDRLYYVLIDWFGAQEELEAWVEEGLLDLKVAFSRDQVEDDLV